jgi:hypothetical protein
VDTTFYCSFLVRLWHEAPEAGGAWRGEVESIQSGQLVTVQSLDEALEIIRQVVGHSQPPAGPTSESDHVLTNVLSSWHRPKRKRTKEA